MNEDDAKEYHLTRMEAGLYRAILESALARLPNEVVLAITESFRAKVMPKFPEATFGSGTSERLQKILDDLQSKYGGDPRAPSE